MTKITQTELNATLCTAHSAHASVRSSQDTPKSSVHARVVTLNALVASGVVCCALLGARPAHGAPPPPKAEQDDGRNARPQQQAQQQQAKPAPRDGAPVVVRQDDAEARRRAAMMQESYAARAAGLDAAKKNSRLTPEERRDLRRQINEAGQDIYSRPPKR